MADLLRRGHRQFSNRLRIFGFWRERGIDRRNRRSQSEFLCRFCGMQKHADVNAACTVKGRRSSGLGDKFLTKGAILTLLTRQHGERFPRSQGAAADPRLTNRYWSVAARNALTQDLASCVQKQ